MQVKTKERGILVFLCLLLCSTPALSAGERLKLSTGARNSFAGTIAHVTDEGDAMRLTVDIGERLRVNITKRSFREMQLNLGSPVYVTFKSSFIEAS